MDEIRTLRADEVECRVATVQGPSEKKKAGCSLLLYKDARCDMRILDEVFGPMGWTRRHEEIGGRLYCTISVRDAQTGEWVSKQDVGTESSAEKEKGQASDSFKRAGFNWGIGRELYTAPFIWVPLEDKEVVQKGQSWAVKQSFSVRKIGYTGAREICELVISDRTGKVRFEMRAAPDADAKRLQELTNATKKLLVKLYGDKAQAEAYWNEHIAPDAGDIGRMEYHYKAIKNKAALMEGNHEAQV